MFPNLEAELKRRNIKRVGLAELLGYTVGTISEKMTGGSSFSFDDAIKIKKFLGVNVPLETLFATEPDTTT